MAKEPKYSRREDYYEDRELKAKADLAELENAAGGFMGMTNFMPGKGKTIGALARFKVLKESERPVEYDGILSGRAGGAIMAAILVLLGLFVLGNMISRYL